MTKDERRIVVLVQQLSTERQARLRAEQETRALRLVVQRLLLDRRASREAAEPAAGARDGAEHPGNP